MKRLMLASILGTLAQAQTVYFGSRSQAQLSSVEFQSPQATVIADFNNDGKPDLAVPSNGTAGITILTGKGDGTFEPPRLIRIQNPCFSLAAADLDGDGNVDLAGVDPRMSRIFTLRGDGAGGFSPWLSLAPARVPYRLTLADFNADGYPDLAVTDRSTSEVQVLINDGAGGFGRPVATRTGLDPTFLTAADFTGDSLPDLITVNLRDRNASLLIGNGDGTFRPAIPIADGVAPATVVAADFNGDQKTDLAFGTNDEYVVVLAGNGDGSFGGPDWYLVGRPAYLVAGDVDRDGKIDLVGALPAGARLIYMKGAGDGSFADAEVLAAVSTPAYVALADLDGDGSLDAVATSSSNATVSVYLNPASGGFRLSQELGAARPTAVAVADLNGDGKPDLAVTTIGVSGVWVLEGYGDGTVKDPVRYRAGLSPAAVAVADFNRDGFPDLAVANAESGNVSVLVNKGNGVFQAAQNVPASDICDPASLAAADFNQDGYPDLAVACRRGLTLEVMLARADGAFERPLQIGLNYIPMSIATADFNGDGIPDLAAAIPEQGVRLYYSNGDGTFRRPVDLPAGTSCTNLLAADLNGDGQADLAAACGGSGAVVVLLAAGSGSFRRLELPAGKMPLYLAAADLTGDGRADLAVMDGSSLSVTTHAGNGSGAFLFAGELGLAPGSSAIAAADFNGDSRADLVVCEMNLSQVSIFLSAPDGVPPPPPLPVSPADNATVPQNNPATFCPADPVNGTGFSLPLRWTSPSSAIAGLTVVVQKQGAPRPLAELGVSTTSASTTLNYCSFLPDAELESWQWWLRARDSVGNVGPPSPPASFRFAPCRLADGRPCGTQAPPQPPMPPPGGLLRMSVARAYHTATLLANGKVLVTGGMALQSGRTIALNTAELYDLATRTFSATGAMRDARAYHTATLLPDGRVLVAGGMTVAAGQAPTPVISAEVYEPARGVFVPVGNLTVARNLHTATLLSDGRVLLAGGLPGQGSALPVADIFNPASGQFQALPPMTVGRVFHTATLLRDSRVLLAGGAGLSSAEYFVPATNNFQPAGAMLNPRTNHEATLLSDGRVLITGGLLPQNQGVAQGEVFNPATGAFSPAGNMVIPRWNHTATAISGGRVLILGGMGTPEGITLPPSETYLPGPGTFVPGPNLATGRAYHTATLLPDGSVLVVGGASGGGARGLTWLDSAEVVPPPQ